MCKTVAPYFSIFSNLRAKREDSISCVFTHILLCFFALYLHGYTVAFKETSRNKTPSSVVHLWLSFRRDRGAPPPYLSNDNPLGFQKTNYTRAQCGGGKVNHLLHSYGSIATKKGCHLGRPRNPSRNHSRLWGRPRQ